MSETETKTHKCEDIRWLERSEGIQFSGLSTTCFGDKRDDWCDGPYEIVVRHIIGTPFKEKVCQTCGRSVKRRHRGKYIWNAPHSKECRCQGRGRVRVNTLEAWLDAADTLGGWALENFMTETAYKMEFFSMPPEHANNPVGRAPTYLQAIQQAICKALNQHPEETK